MKKSARAKRMHRYHGRFSSQSKLNLVSLMDIFTILVFFLLLNSSDVEVLDNNNAVELPDSISDISGENKNLKISVKTEGVWIGQEKVIEQVNNIEQLNYSFKDFSLVLSSLKKGKDQEELQTITLLADKDMPFQLINQIMKKCSEIGFDKVNFAVNKVHDS